MKCHLPTRKIGDPLYTTFQKIFTIIRIFLKSEAPKAPGLFTFVHRGGLEKAAAVAPAPRCPCRYAEWIDLLALDACKDDARLASTLALNDWIGHLVPHVPPGLLARCTPPLLVAPHISRQCSYICMYDGLLKGARACS